MGAATITGHRDGQVLRLTITNPEQANALTPAMLGELTAHLAGAAADPEVRVVVLRGEGGRFSSGYALSSFPEPDDLHEVDELTEAGEAIAGFPKAIVAVLEGDAIGASLDLALAADFRIAAADLRTGITPARFGIVYPWQGMARLVDRVGSRSARRLLLTAELVDANTALDLGLVDEVVDPASLDEVVDRWVGRLLRAAPLSVSGTKFVLGALGSCGDRVAADELRRDHILALRREALGSRDAKEAVVAFGEKRPARFEGR